MDEVNGWNERVSDFFLEYVRPHDKESYTPLGNLTFTTMRNASKKLLDEDVFSDVSDMRQQAMKDFGVILPEELFV